MALEVSIELVTHDGVLVVALAGELDRADTDALREQVLEGLAPEAPGLVCDLALLSYIDSAGVHLLHTLARTQQAGGRRIALVPPRDAMPRRVLELTGIPAVIAFHPTVEDALRHLQDG